RLELQTNESERAREQLEARHAEATDRAARELREVCAAHDSEMASSKSEASERQQGMLDEHRRELEELTSKMEELREWKEREAAEKDLQHTAALQDAAAAAAERERLAGEAAAADAARDAEALQRSRDEEEKNR
ncbi:unnamed protein product, partial [Ectocarpus sp. 12 AP-2014]